MKLFGFILLFFILTSHNSHANPPFSGTIFLDPDIIVPSDPTTFENLVDSGRGERLMFDRRINGWVTLKAILFGASYKEFIGTYARENASREDIANS